jgi:N-acetylmuramoyl-L-alanine amidase
MQKKQVFLAAATLFAAATFTIPSAFAGSTSVTPQKVTVHAGDTLWKIAHRYHISLSALEQSNPTIHPQNLLIGTVLTLPGVSHPSPSQSSSAKSATTASKAVTSSSMASSVNAQNLYWLSRVIHAEAGGESMQAQIAVGDVVMHRVQAAGTAATVKQIVFAIDSGHYQFSCVQNGYIYTSPDSNSQKAAIEVYQGRQDIVPGAYVFYDPAYTPASSWVRKQPVITAYGSLTFAK